jgi:aspartate/methionine/tyrosine aminotransferase
MNLESFDAKNVFRLATRVAKIKPFQAMEMLKAAGQLSASGRNIIAMNLGEPDFTAPDPVRRAASAPSAAIEHGTTKYSDALGLPSLREAISWLYCDRFGIDVDPSRIVVTAGASAALLLACAALVSPGDEVLMPDPCYPCNRQFVSAFGGEPKQLPTQAVHNFQLAPANVDQAWSGQTSGIIVSTPSNPTGASMNNHSLASLLSIVSARGGFPIIDEIYYGLTYDQDTTTALTYDDNAIVVNSFSKYFGMTGWRLGWLIAPESLRHP